MKFSVIVPVRDDAAGLEVAVDGLRQQSEPPDEVIVVNASDGPLVPLVPIDLPHRVVEAGPALPGRARNAGARVATHPWLVFLDAGARPLPAWLESFRLAAEAAPGANVIYGCYVASLRDEWDRAAAGVYLPPGAASDPGCHPTTASLCVRRSFWETTAGMPENLRAGEDLLFFRGLEASRAQTTLAPGARVVWDLPSGAWGHYRRLRKYSSATWPTELARRWQWPLIRMYGAAIALLASAAVFQPVLAALVPTLVAVRVVRNYRRRRSGLDRALTPARALRLVAMTGLVDAATLLGVWDSLRARP